MSWRTVLLRTRIEAVLTRGDPPRDPGDFKKSRRSGNIPVLLGSLLVSLIVGCNEGRVEQPAPKATAEQRERTGWS
jgi:hypothetical protein